MKLYISKSSELVKTITIGTLIVALIITATLLTVGKSFSPAGQISMTVIIVSILFYFYSNSLDKVILEGGKIVLKKNIGNITIPIAEINNVRQMEYSNLSMTYGSKGLFGFIGNTMDNSVSLVKDRSKMILIETYDKKYLFSSDNPKELVYEISLLMNSL